MDDIGQAFSLLTLTRAGGCREWRHLTGRWLHELRRPYYEFEGASDVSQGRSEVASWWLANHDTKWSVWLDDDHPITLEDLDAFCRTALKHSDRLDLLCASYVPKVPRSGALTVLLQPRKCILGQGGALVPIHACGFGLVAVKRRLFERIAPTLPLVRYMLTNTLGRPYFLGRVEPSPADPDGAARHQGEDFAFCYRATAVGGRLYCDTRVRLGHKGSYVYHWEDMRDGTTYVDTIEITREHPLETLQNKERQLREQNSTTETPPPGPSLLPPTASRAERRAAKRARKRR